MVDRTIIDIIASFSGPGDIFNIDDLIMQQRLEEAAMLENLKAVGEEEYDFQDSDRKVW